MRAAIKRLHSPDVDIETFVPDSDDYGFLLQITAGPENEEGEESFDITVCSPKWVARQAEIDGVLSGRHYLIVTDYSKVKPYIQKYVSNCYGEKWDVIAEKLSRLGHWEFEDYQE